MSEGRDPTQAASAGGDPSVLGRTIAGKFVVEKFLGGGAMGAVYRARWPALEKNVAIKVMHRSIAQEASFAARFAREAKAAARLDHPNSIRVIDSGEEADGLLYIAMEYVEGRDLYRVIHEDWPISDSDIVDILAQALSAIGVAHEMGVIHRDLKPENLMILPGRNDGEEGRYLVKVCDFGIAKITSKGADGSEGASISHNLTTHGLVVGTPEYMSPEQARGERLDARSDIYSAGVILYQLLTGRTPFTGEHALAVVLQHVTANPPAPHEIYPDVHKGLEAVCVKAIAKEREDRYQTARDMRMALRSAIDARSASTPRADALGATVKAPAVAPALSAAVTRVTPPGLAAGTEPPKKSRVGLFIGAAVMIVVIGVGAAYAHSLSEGGASEAPATTASAPAVAVPAAVAPNASVSASPSAVSVHSAPKAPKISVVASASASTSASARPAASASVKGTERAVAPSASASPASSEPAPSPSPSAATSGAMSPSATTTTSAAPAASPTPAPTPSQAAPSFNPAACKAHLGAPKGTGSVNAKDLRLNGTAAAWNTCAQRMKEKPATPISTSVRLRFGDNKSFHGASCAACPAPVAHCIAQSTGKTVALELHGADVTGEPAFDVPVTLSCD
ncbi:Serine/threonine protein kinase PrkC, regulator of stationary phase [Labilithrix luteola]|uniref:non-specific serine/threonine protein kinase n=1 Tax=Labilithrix luteola TaxID=1391654 RepID=A0A0K1PYR7_9BACT|nr:protein kinase [Labilithrix luteola]AKU98536.1 Serine/threonine protein kinase PrkC, regulator of stationary phase [Labilithrix luteola]